MALNKVTTIDNAQIGDYIPCRYVATTSGQVGNFSEFGTCTANEIPTSGTATPNGLFNFIKVDKGLWIADRVVQTNISYDALNSKRFIEGFVLNLKNTYLKPTFTGTFISFNCSFNKSSKIFRLVPLEKGQYSGYAEIATIKFYNQNGVEVTPISVKDVPCYGTDKAYKMLDNNDETWFGSAVNATDPLEFTFSDDVIISRYEIKLRPDYQAAMYGKWYVDNDKENCLIRSISGGVAYADANGNSSFTEKGYGAFPKTNEWEKYIVNGDLDGKITPGDNNIWHWNTLYSWTKETSIFGFVGWTTGNSTHRILRGHSGVKKVNIGVSSTSNDATVGFRPVFEISELNSKQTNPFY